MGRYKRSDPEAPCGGSHSAADYRLYDTRGSAPEDVGGLGTPSGNRHTSEVFAGDYAGVAKDDCHRQAAREVR